MILEIGTAAAKFLFWEYLFQILVLVICNALMDAKLESTVLKKISFRIFLVLRPLASEFQKSATKSPKNIFLNPVRV
jgi:hypothetical protein